MVEEFVVFDATGKECDWYDPYVDHQELDDRLISVELGHDNYEVEIPVGGRYEVREMSKNV